MHVLCFSYYVCADRFAGVAMMVLLRYLAGSSASVLDNTIVEKEQLASGVYYYAQYRPITLFQFSISSVATDSLEAVEARFFEILRETALKSLDMKFLQECIQVERAQVKFQSETSSEFFSEPVLRDFLFGNRDGSTLREDLENLDEYDAVEAWPEAKWKSYLSTWFSDAKHITLYGKPSLELSDRLKSEETARVAARREQLGEDGLKKLSEKLENAKAENNREIPRSFLEKYQVPDPSSIKFISTITARSGSAKSLGIPKNRIQTIIDNAEQGLPLFIQFEHVKSNFALLHILVDTEDVPVHLRPLLDIYAESFFSSPLIRDGKRIEFEQVVMEMELDTVGYALSSGASLGAPEALKLAVHVEVEKYEWAISKIKEVMFQTIFDIERLQSTITRRLAEIPEEKRDGNDMSMSVNNMIKMSPASITRAGNTLTRTLYFKLVKKLLQRKPEALVSQLDEIRRILCQPSNFRVLVVADVEKLSHPVSGWRKLVGDLDNSNPLKPLKSQYDRLSELGKNPAKLAYVVPMPTIDSSFLLADAKGPRSYEDEVLPALTVALAYLNAVEGPLWNAVRGTGLAYGTAMDSNIGKGRLALDVYRSPDSFKAFNASRAVIESYVNGDTEIDSLALEGAISSIVLSFANSESTMSSAAQISFIRQVVRGVPKDWPTIQLGKVKKVTPEELRSVMKEVILPIFRPETSTIVVTCAPGMQENLVHDLQSSGYQTEVKPLTFFQDDYGYGAECGLSDEEADGSGESETEEDSDDQEDAVNGEL